MDDYERTIKTRWLNNGIVLRTFSLKKSRFWSYKVTIYAIDPIPKRNRLGCCTLHNTHSFKKTSPKTKKKKIILCLMGMGVYGKTCIPHLPYNNTYMLTFNILRSTLQCYLLKYCLLALLIKCKKARICGALLVVKYRASIKKSTEYSLKDKNGKIPYLWF